MPSGNKPLPQPMLTQFSCRHMASLGLNELMGPRSIVLVSGRTMLGRLVKEGIKCSYMFINAASYVMPEVGNNLFQYKDSLSRYRILHYKDNIPSYRNNEVLYWNQHFFSKQQLGILICKYIEIYLYNWTEWRCMINSLRPRDAYMRR